MILPAIPRSAFVATTLAAAAAVCIPADVMAVLAASGVQAINVPVE